MNFGDKVQGECPNGCGETLFLGKGGYVTCSSLRCSDPGAATKMLQQAARISTYLLFMESWLPKVPKL